MADPLGSKVMAMPSVWRREGRGHLRCINISMLMEIFRHQRDDDAPRPVRPRRFERDDALRQQTLSDRLNARERRIQ